MEEELKNVSNNLKSLEAQAEKVGGREGKPCMLFELNVTAPRPVLETTTGPLTT